MTDTVVARRYAGALFDLAKKQGGNALADHGACLAELKEMMAQESRLGQIFKSPVVSVEEKKALVGKLLDAIKADTTMRNFCFLLTDKNRLGILSEIADWYGVLLDAANGVMRGRVLTAIRLSPERQEQIRDSLRQKTGKDLELSFSIDPEILGGMILVVGDRVMDASLRAQLGMLRENLRRG